MNVENMLKSISDGTPTPGGGAVGWIVLGQGTALLRMVSNLTLKSKKWSGGHDPSRTILDATADFESRATDGYDADCHAYESVVNAYKLPEENQERQRAIESASLLAAEVPLELMETALEISLLSKGLFGLHNKNAHSDLISSGLLLKTAAIIGSKNVEANIPYLSGEDSVGVKARHEEVRIGLMDVIPMITEGGGL